MTPMLPNPFMFDESIRFDEATVMEGIEAALFSEPEMDADEIEPILRAIYRAAA